MFAANNPLHTKGFQPIVDGFDQVPFGDHSALENAINEKTAIMVETILGEEVSELFLLNVCRA